MTPEQAKILMEAYSKIEIKVPDNILKLANTPKDLDTMFNDFLQHSFWKNTTITSYDVTQHHLPSDVNPEDPRDFFFTFFWTDTLLEHIVKETNIYIAKKNASKKSKKKKNQIHK